MLFLILGLIVFFGVHLIALAPPLKRRLVARLGANVYKVAFALAALIGLILIIVGYGYYAARIPVWDPPAFGPYLAVALMPLALILLAAAFLPSNIRRFTAHPMLWAVVVWALCHLLVRGDRASVLLFGGFLVFALLAMVAGGLRGDRPEDSEKSRHPVWQDVLVVIAGLIGFAVLLWLHPFLFGVPVLR